MHELVYLYNTHTSSVSNNLRPKKEVGLFYTFNNA